MNKLKLLRIKNLLINIFNCWHSDNYNNINNNNNNNKFQQFNNVDVSVGMLKLNQWQFCKKRQFPLILLIIPLFINNYLQICYEHFHDINITKL